MRPKGPFFSVLYPNQNKRRCFRGKCETLLPKSSHPVDTLQRDWLRSQSRRIPITSGIAVTNHQILQHPWSPGLGVSAASIHCHQWHGRVLPETGEPAMAGDPRTTQTSHFFISSSHTRESLAVHTPVLLKTDCLLAWVIPLDLF